MSENINGDPKSSENQILINQNLRQLQAFAQNAMFKNSLFLNLNNQQHFPPEIFTQFLSSSYRNSWERLLFTLSPKVRFRSDKRITAFV